MMHGYGEAAGLAIAVATPSMPYSGPQTREKTTILEQWHPFGRHVLLSDVVRILAEARKKRLSAGNESTLQAI